MSAIQKKYIPTWLLSTAVYQVNPRTFSAEGTIAAVTARLPELKELGIGTVYLCPIFEEDDGADQTNWSIRQKRSKTGNPKNPYRMNDYFKIDEEYGCMDDLRELVSVAHSLGMRVLLDLVYFHIGPNAPILKEHPEFVLRDEGGAPLLGDWSFPVFDYSCKGTWEYLLSNMTYYIGAIGVDGFRCDVGDRVPLDFWAEGLKRMQSIHPDAILINEGEKTEYLSVFHAMYAFHWHDALYRVMVNGERADLLQREWQAHRGQCDEDGLFLRDMDNHDTVTDWPDRIENLVGHNGMELITALNFILDGIPMLYCGNELADSKRLSMFANRFHPGAFEVTDRSIACEPYSQRRQQVVKTLCALRKNHPDLALGKTNWLASDRPAQLIAFSRDCGSEQFLFLANVTKESVSCAVSSQDLSRYTVILESEEKIKAEGERLLLPPLSYAIYKKR